MSAPQKPQPVAVHTMKHGGAGLIMAGARDRDLSLIGFCREALASVELWRSGRNALTYDVLYGRLEVLCQHAEREPPTSDEGLRAKAEVVRELLGPGICVPEALRLAISLANDLLGRA